MTEQSSNPTAFLGELISLQTEAIRQFMTPFTGGLKLPQTGPESAASWADTAAKLQELWLEFQQALLSQNTAEVPVAEAGAMLGTFEQFVKRLPLVDAQAQRRLWEDGLKLWQGILGTWMPDAGAEAGDLPRKDRRFSDPLWSSHPAFALIHQTYLLLAERIEAAVDTMEGIAPEKREQLRFAVRSLVDTLSPANFPNTNPVVIQRTLETKGQNLVKGMEHLLADLKRGKSRTRRPMPSPSARIWPSRRARLSTRRRFTS